MPWLLQAMLEAAVGLAGGDRQQPAISLQGVEKVEDTVEQRFFDPALLPRPRRSSFCRFRRTGRDRVRARHRGPISAIAFDQAESDHAAGRRAAAAQRGRAGRMVSATAAKDGRAAVNQCAVAIEKRPAGSLARPVPADGLGNIGPAGLGSGRGSLASMSAAGLCWLNLRVPRMASGAISKPTMARVKASNRRGSILSRVQGACGLENALEPSAQPVQLRDQLAQARFRGPALRSPPTDNATSAPDPRTRTNWRCDRRRGRKCWPARGCRQ